MSIENLYGVKSTAVNSFIPLDPKSCLLDGNVQQNERFPLQSPGHQTSDGLKVRVMETRLRAKRKDTEREAAKLESQVVTRSAAKKARAAGIAAPLLQTPGQAAPTAAGGRSDQKPRGRENRAEQEPQSRARASARTRAAAKQEPEPTTDPRQLEAGREDHQGEAGPSAPRPGQRAVVPPAAEQADGPSDMDRQTREEADAGRGREGVDDEVRCV